MYRSGHRLILVRVGSARSPSGSLKGLICLHSEVGGSYRFKPKPPRPIEEQLGHHLAVAHTAGLVRLYESHFLSVLGRSQWFLALSLGACAHCYMFTRLPVNLFPDFASPAELIPVLRVSG